MKALSALGFSPQRINRRSMLILVLLLFLVGGFIATRPPFSKQTELLILPQGKTLVTSINYSLHEAPRFIIKRPKKILGIDFGYAQYSPTDSIKAELITPQGGAIPLTVSMQAKTSMKKSLVSHAYAQDASVSSPGALQITPDAEGNLEAFLPSLTNLPDTERGNYRLAVTWKKNGTAYKNYFDFAWGVLVMNATKDVFATGEQVNVGVGVVDGRGDTVCNSKLQIGIVSPSGKSVTLLTRDNGQGDGIHAIANSRECGYQTVTNTPDYHFSFPATEVGQYQLHLKAQTEAGERTLDQVVEVEAAPTLQIERSMSMRIYPLAKYTVTLRVRSTNTVEDSVVESVPASFKISECTCTKTPDGQRLLLTWKEQKIDSKTPLTLSYTYDAPDISPALWQVGPLQVGTQTEKRIWMVAADSTPTLTAGPRLATSSSDCTDDASTGTVTWTSPGNAAASDGTSATASVDGSTTHYLKCLNYGFTTSTVPTGSTIVGIVATVNRSSSSTSNGGSNDAAMRLVKAGTIGSTDRATATTYTTGLVAEDHGGSSDLWGDTWAVSDVTNTTFGAAFAATKASAAGAAHTVSVDYISISIYYQPPQPTLIQRHYLFQQDDGANVNSNSNNGSADTALTNVKKGERLNARFQIDNTGAGDFTNGQYELFYDKSNDIWTKVESGQPLSSGGSCSNSAYDCTVIEDISDNVGQYNSVAVSSSGKVWVSYYDSTASSLKVAQYVGSGGTGCGVGGTGSSAWSCSTVDDPTDLVGQNSLIAISPDGKPWIAYEDQNLSAVKVAQYVGSGGTGCTNLAWTCTTVIDNSDFVVPEGLAFASDGTAWLVYNDVTLASINIAEYVSSGGSCTSTAWTCTTIEDPSDSVGGFASLTISPNGSPWVAYQDSTANALKVAQYVGSSGTGCGSGGTGSSSWTCSVVDDPADSVATQYNSIAFTPSGQAWVAYNDGTTASLRVAKYVGSGGTGCTDFSWTCTVVEDPSDTVGTNISMAISPIGVPWIVYTDSSVQSVKEAHYVGSGGTGCGTGGTGSTAWYCETVDDDAVNNRGISNSISFLSGGQPIISSYDSTVSSLRSITINTGHEILPSYGLSGSNGDALTSNAAGSCQTGTTYSNGTWQQGVNVSTASTLASNKCTEVSFMIDTSQAAAGTTYRLALRDKTDAQGLTTYSTYPTFTVVASGSDTFRSSKDSVSRLSGSCTDTNWDCEVFDTINSTANVSDGRYEQVAIDPSGVPWVTTHDNTGKAVRVDKYTPGTAASGNCSANWTCTIPYSDGTTNSNVGPALAFDPSGTAWMAFQDWDNKDFRIAKYVGSGGTGCGASGSTAWTCAIVDSNSASEYYSIAFSPAGLPWITYAQVTGALQLARYTPGAAASGTCAANWTCSVIDATAATDVSQGNSITFDQNGKAWVSYQDVTNSTVKVADYVGSGGNCTGSNGEWNCTTVQTGSSASGATGVRTSIAINPATNTPWFSYSDTTNTALAIAQYVGTGGNCSSSAAWNCTTVDNTGTSTGRFQSMIFDSSGAAWIAYYDLTNTALRVARYVGGTSGNCTSTAWNCTQVDNTGTDTGQWASIASDRSGDLWVGYMNLTATDGTAKVAKLVLPTSRQQLGYKLDNQGYTYVGADDTSFDQMAATTNTPAYRFSIRSASNTTLSVANWIGKSSVAASTNNILLQVYRFGTTNAWETVTTNSSCSANTDCTITGTPSGTASEYFEADGSNYWIHYRVYQVAGTSKTLQTDYFGTSVGPSAIAFTNPTRLLSTNVCSGAGSVFTIELQNGGVATNPSQSTVVRISSTSPGVTVYSDNTCQTSVTNGDFTFSTSQNSKSFYIIDSSASTPTWTLSATRQSGDTLSTATQSYTVTAPSDSTVQGGTVIQGGTTLQ